LRLTNIAGLREAYRWGVVNIRVWDSHLSCDVIN